MSDGPDTSEPDLSVEAVMARLKESAAERAASAEEGVGSADAPPGSAGTAVRDALRGQADFNQSVAQALRWAAQTFRRLQGSIEGGDESLRELAQLHERASRELEALRMRVLRLERADRVERAPRTPSALPPPPSGGGGEAVAAGPADRPFDYFLFEQRFRGPLAEIKRRQAGYLDLFRGRKAVLDLGCGRGEFLELLAEHGIPVTGVDRSEDMVDFCRDRGLPAVQADLFDHLAGLPDHGLDGVFVAQVVEHLPPAAIARLIGLCADKLAPGGVMVAETVNPGCPVALGNFYRDPTHVRPVPAELLSFLFEQAGFAVRCLRFSAPTGGGGEGRPEVLEVEAGFAPGAEAYQDYAVVAVRRPEGEPCGS